MKVVPVSFSSRFPSSSGVALVMVMIILVLVAGLAVALLSLARTERKSAAVFLISTEVRQLTDNAVGIVQAQINQATTQGSAVAWASQPGMVRTYKADGTLKMAYKLYSTQTLTETDPSKLSGDVAPNTWAGSPAIWTDLNAPVNASGQNVYPILDPGILSLPISQQPLGFAIQNAPGSTANQLAPMPVQWLYVLQQGQIISPDAGGNGTVATFVNATVQPSTSNPITGRIAFWTDDESCKVNLNTAGAGTNTSVTQEEFWDTPHFYTTEDLKFGSSQPLNGEFQRYPGHPATTSLNAVFPQLTDQQILSTLTPRYQWGGSQQGTVDTYTMTQALNNGTVANNPLYADTDDIIFQTSRSSRAQNPNLTKTMVDQARFFLTTDSRAPEVNLFDLPRVACWPISSDLASNPNSLYTTAFDKVIAKASVIGNSSNLYYFQRQNNLSSTADANIARNQSLFTYLHYLTSQSIPGFGVSLADKFGADQDQILTEIWDYIRSTNLYDTRLAAGNEYTAQGVNNTSGSANNAGTGYGYVVPLQNGSSLGFGRSLTLSELAFVFICTADSVDQTNQPPPGPHPAPNPDPKGLMGSNDPVNNLTLGGVALTSPQRRVQMMIVPTFFSPSQGDISIRPKGVSIAISGLSNLTLAGQSLFSSNVNNPALQFDYVAFNTGYHRRYLGGSFDYRSLLAGVFDPGILDSSSFALQYPFISNFVTVTPDANGRMSFGTGPLTVTITWSGGGSQTINITPPSSLIPVPNLVCLGTIADTTGSGAAATTAPYWWAFSNSRPWKGNTTDAPATTQGRLYQLGVSEGYFIVSGGVPLANSNPSSNQPFAGSLIREAETANTSYYTDVVRSMAPSHGDMRLIAGLANVPSQAFTPIGDWTATGSAFALMHNLASGNGIAFQVAGGNQWRRHYVTSNTIGTVTTTGAGGGYGVPVFRTDTPSAVINAVIASGDFDNGTAFWADGAYINKPDEGNALTTVIPYFGSTDQELENSTGFFSPNRIMPGPGMFGSLPTHIQRYAADPSHPELYAWRTLLFRNQPTHPDAAPISTGGMPTAGIAPDHLLMDLFWMPTVEPYAISDPFSTAGKVNMNYQLQPFPYIQRETGLYAVLQREKIPAVANTTTNQQYYKSSNNVNYPQSGTAGSANIKSLRLNLDVAQTLQQFDNRFADASGRIFLSPTELCDLWLVPQGQALGGMSDFWSGYGLTGDNMRERPYTTIIPRLTTKSNTFTVHYRVQTLKVPKTVTLGTWDETRGVITGEYRGSTTIQRFIDLSNANIPDYTVNTSSQPTLGNFYRWRVINTRQFAP